MVQRKWLVASFDEWTFYAAAANGHLDVLQWDRLNGFSWDYRKGACATAVQRGHLEVLQWARENSCPWNEWTCADAAGGGHLEVLQWAREDGRLWMGACSLAANGRLEVDKMVVRGTSQHAQMLQEAVI